MKNIISKYNFMGDGYNATRQADPYLVSRILYLLVPGEDGNFFDIGCGIGNYTIVFQKTGLQKLRYDLDHQLFESVKMKYYNTLGDYLFTVVQKNKGYK